MPDLDPTLLILVVPLIAVQLGMLVVGLLDLVRPERRVRGGSKAVWALIIALVGVIGPLIYFLAGREEAEGAPEPEPPGPGARAGWFAPDPGPVTAQRPTMGPADAAGALGPTSISAASISSDVAADRPVGERAGVEERPAASAAADSVVRMPASPRGAPAIEIDGLTKRYRGPGGGVLALDRLSMTVPTGSVFGLLGPNGAGKTTCLRLLIGLTRPTAGQATLAGQLVDGQVLEVRRRLGYLEQDPRAYAWLTGREQVAMVGRLHGLDGGGLERAVGESLERVGLAAAAHRRVGTYSGGMRQRLGIATALVHRPPILILDEPVSALDPEGRRDVLGLIHDLRGESTILFSTHVLADVERICDRVGILDQGRLVVEGPLDQLLDRYALPVYRIEAEPGQDASLASLASRLRELDWVTETRAEHGLLTVAVADPERAARGLLGSVAASGLAVISVARARPTLEDVFLQLTGNNRGAA
jgi:ABC-2 type transport system ATP-binding protein